MLCAQGHVRFAAHALKRLNPECSITAEFCNLSATWLQGNAVLFSPPPQDLLHTSWKSVCLHPRDVRCPSKADRDPGAGVLLHPHNEILTIILSAVPGRSVVAVVQDSTGWRTPVHVQFASEGEQLSPNSGRAVTLQVQRSQNATERQLFESQDSI